MKVTVQSDVASYNAKKLRELSSIGPKVLAIATAAASEETATKTYTNRTFKLTTLTIAFPEQMNSDGFTIILNMGYPGVEYGKYVQARGFSNFEAIADGAAREIDALMGSLG